MSSVKLATNCHECGIHINARNEIGCNDGKPHDFSAEPPHADRCNHCLIPFKHRGGRYCVPGKRHNFDLDYQKPVKEDEKPTTPSKPKIDKARLDAYAQAALTGLLSKGDTSYSIRVQDLAVDMAILTMHAVDEALKEENK
ncbi:hypothetical protein Ares1_0081 [Vibrio phage Ares1]|nr:hypothetical protein Ares1_0081 [Vibrio phage Ares1]